jgi:hypothetical protein
MRYSPRRVCHTLKADYDRGRRTLAKYILSNKVKTTNSLGKGTVKMD